jgi:3-oxoacyl-[acyl-carrier protein] reductase
LELDLEEKVAIVTGSSKGLGFAAARALIEEGCRVTICARGEAALGEAAAALQAVAGNGPARVLAVAADLSTAEGVETVVARTVETFGGLDILVNNVGTAKGAGIADTTDAEWQASFDQTLFPAVRASRLAVPLMRKRGGGAIVMIASILGAGNRRANDLQRVKAAEISLAKAMAQQLAKGQHPRQQRGAWIDSVSGRIVGSPRSGGSRRDGGVRGERASVRAVWPPRRGRGGRRVPGFRSSELDQRGKCDR